MAGAEPIRVGIVGLGGIARAQHVPGYLMCDGVEIAALCDLNEAALREVARICGAPRCYADYHEMLAHEGLTAVDVCTWPDMHHPIAMEALARGKHVFCEKPLALTYPLAREMYQASVAAGLKTGVGFTHRQTPAARFAHRIIASGALGAVYHVVAVYASGRSDYQWLPATRRRTRAVTGGGPLFELGPHMVDMVRWWTGEEVTAVCAQTRTYVKQRRLPETGEMVDVDVDDGAVIMTDLSGGGTATFINSSVFTGRNFDQRVEVYGSKGSLLYDQATPFELRVCVGQEMLDLWSGYGLYDARYGLHRREEPLPVVPVPTEILDAIPGADQRRLMRTFVPDFVDAIRGRERPHLPTFYDGMRAQEVLDAALLSVAERRWVDLPL